MFRAIGLAALVVLAMPAATRMALETGPDCFDLRARGFPCAALDRSGRHAAKKSCPFAFVSNGRKQHVRALRLLRFFANLRKRVEHAPKDARFAIGARNVVRVVPAQAGRKLDEKGTTRNIMAALDTKEALVLERCLRKLTDRARQIYDVGGGVDVRANRRLGGSRRFWS